MPVIFHNKGGKCGLTQKNAPRMSFLLACAMVRNWVESSGQFDSVWLTT